MSRTLLSGVSVLLLAVVAVASMACGGDDGDGEPTAAPTATATATATATPDGTPSGNGTRSKLVMSDLPRRVAEPAAVGSVGEATEAFAVDLYLALAEGDENIVFSPYSAAIALAMTRNGAAGRTASEMDAVLHADLAGDLNAGFNATDQALSTVPGEYDIGADEPVVVELSTANQLWGQEGFGFRSEFLDSLAANYGAGMRLVDYVEATEDARQTINGWVSDETRERIPELLQEGVLTRDTRLVLTNAIYMKAQWLVPFFEDSTADGRFTTLGGGEVTVPMMRLSEDLQYASGDGYQAVVLPYAGEQLSMLVVVPDEGSFDFVEARIGDVVGEVDGSLTRPQVMLEFPRFEFRTQAALKQILIDLGMPTAFSDAADFSGMTDEAQLSIQDVVHEAFISVDEDGTEAAAATAMIMHTTSMPLDPPEPIELTVDRPFLFLIRHDETGAVLFMGRVGDPSAD